ncbi:hypothetical protein DBR32_11730 [Taibaiella sp. KBW10]|uniref:tetratricopeptide repeat protein n=1 Tax=Taibaiella sp. KBW10 TaxID=2153357 RepID=UPI000F59917D|nr:tetratricopeptide repeat protein [Taibaiella sp. KBW10]RQO30240.1 hypothetical protein DBR32_11730 [Taibaiella sp. KBW10]
MAQTSRNKPGVEVFGENETKGKATDVAYSIQNSFEKNQKGIIGVVVAALILVGGYFGYKYLIQAPGEEKAYKDLSYVQKWFEADSLKYVINGDGQHPSGPAVIKKNSGTKAANLAQYYVGMSYLKSKDANNAIKYLSEFNGEGTVIGNLAYGALGDAYMDAGKVDKAIENYKKAASNENDQYTSALYSFRAGLASEKAGKTDEAKKFYKDIKDKYPNTLQARDIDKYLARLGELSID